MVMGVAEHWIGANAADNVAVCLVVGGCVSVLVVKRVVGDQVGELHRGGVLNVADPGIRIADGVVQPFVVGPSNHVVVQSADHFQASVNGAADELPPAKYSGFFAGKRSNNDRWRQQ